MPDEKDPAGPETRPDESSAPAEPAATAATDSADSEAAGAIKTKRLKKKAPADEAKAKDKSAQDVPPPFVVSTTGVPVVPGATTVAGGNWSSLLPPPRDPSSGPWSVGTATAEAPEDEDKVAADKDDETVTEALASAVTVPNKTDETESDKDKADDDAVDAIEEPDFDDDDDDSDDDEDEDEDEDDGGDRPSWAKDVSEGAPRRRQLSPEVKVATFGILAAAILVVAVVLISKSLSGGSTDDSTVSLDNPLATQSAKPAVTTTVGNCVYTEDDGSTGSQVVSVAGMPPSAPTVSTKPATMTMTTNYGAMVFSLDAAHAPCTVHALLHLAQAKYFDGSTCHRETSGPDAGIWVLQCGDPTGTGAGSPGFTYKNENIDGVNYNRGVIAMANAGPDTNGSQFFINYQDPSEDGAAALAGGYTVVGQITQGLDVLDKITGPGVIEGGSDGAPASNPQITSVTITQ